MITIRSSRGWLLKSPCSKKKLHLFQIPGWYHLFGALSWWLLYILTSKWVRSTAFLCWNIVFHHFFTLVWQVFSSFWCQKGRKGNTPYSQMLVLVHIQTLVKHTVNFFGFLKLYWWQKIFNALHLWILMNHQIFILETLIEKVAPLCADQNTVKKGFQMFSGVN